MEDMMPDFSSSKRTSNLPTMSSTLASWTLAFFHSAMMLLSTMCFLPSCPFSSTLLAADDLKVTSFRNFCEMSLRIHIWTLGLGSLTTFFWSGRRRFRVDLNVTWSFPECFSLSIFARSLWPSFFLLFLKYSLMAFFSASLTFMYSVKSVSLTLPSDSTMPLRMPEMSSNMAVRTWPCGVPSLVRSGSTLRLPSQSTIDSSSSGSSL
mmetsp:Transcript_12071/g.35856  ORF Transcript_12071/g.35856 Transcript_12071/m.35856 type:complete len:207 (+) Transcript_12071:1358-1978(+)